MTSVAPAALSPWHPVQSGASRAVGLDALRGLAILCMMVDHATLLSHGPGALRWTIGRLALPAFFVLAGHLAGTPRGRHAVIAGTGLLLPLVVPWIDHPNVLLVYALGVVVLWLFRQAGRPWLLVVLGLTTAVNGLVDNAHGYDPLLLLALMALGACMPRSAFDWTNKLPSWPAVIGRSPLTWYVSHVLVFTAVAALVRVYL